MLHIERGPATGVIAANHPWPPSGIDAEGGRDLPDSWLFDLLNYGPFLIAGAAWLGWTFWGALAPVLRMFL